MPQQLIPLGIVIILIGFILVFIGALVQMHKPDSKSKVAVGGFIGFIPFGFANDKNMLYVLLIFMAALAFLVFILPHLWR